MKWVFLAAKAYFPPPKLEHMTRDFPAWMFPLFVIPLGLTLISVIFRVDLIGETWDFFEKLIMGDEVVTAKRRESLCVIYNTLNKKAKVKEYETGLLLKAWEEISRSFTRQERHEILNCFKQLLKAELPIDEQRLGRAAALVDQKLSQIKTVH